MVATGLAGARVFLTDFPCPIGGADGGAVSLDAFYKQGTGSQFWSDGGYISFKLEYVGKNV